MNARVALFALLALTAVAALAQPAVGARREQVPFQAVFQFTTSVASDAAPCSQIRIDVAGSGVATHLGRFTTVQHQCTTVEDPLAFSGEYRFTAANGDQIYGTYGGRFVPVDAGGHFSVDATWTIDGGTGRFAGATGGGPAGGLATVAGGTVILGGTISSIGSLGGA